MSFRLIGLAAPARSGKDTVANHLRSDFGAYVTSFAAPIRKFVADLCGYTLTELEARKEEVHPVFGQTPRLMMQTLGTEWGRNIINQEIWINIVRDKIAKHRFIWEQKSATKLFVVSDLRFQNEIDIIREEGGEIWHIENPNRQETTASSHASENGLLGLQLRSTDSHILNDQDIKHLYDIIDGLVASDWDAPSAIGE